MSRKIMLKLRPLISICIVLILLSACSQSKQSMCEDLYDLSMKKMKVKLGGNKNAGQMDSLMAAIKDAGIKECVNQSEENIKKELEKVKAM